MTQPTTQKQTLRSQEPIPFNDLTYLELHIDHSGTISFASLFFQNYQTIHISVNAAPVLSTHTWENVKNAIFSGAVAPSRLFYDFQFQGGFNHFPPYSLSGAHLDHLPAATKAQFLANDVLHQEYNMVNYRQKAFHEFILHQYSLAFGFEIEPNKLSLYRNLCIQWAVAGFDPANFSIAANWGIMQKCQQFPILQFSLSYARGEWNNITVGSLVKPVVEGTDWLMRYPTLVEEDDVDPIAQTNATFLQNAGSVYDQNSNYAKGIYLLNYGLNSKNYGGV